MAYYVRIGSIPSNRSGVGARGYHAFRRNNAVVIAWGGVVVAEGRRFRWAQPPQRRVYRGRTPEGARALLERIAKERRKNKYSLLPPGARIAPSRSRR